MGRSTRGGSAGSVGPAGPVGSAGPVASGGPAASAPTPPTVPAAAPRGRRLRSLVSDLSGRTDREMVRLLRHQVDAALAGCRLAAVMVSGREGATRARAEMVTVEHHGDAAREQVILAMERSVVSPIDREDLFRLSRSIDDILDTLRDVVRLADLFVLEDRTRLRSLAEPLVDDLAEGLVSLADAVQSLVDDPRRVAMMAHSAKKNGLGRRYIEGVAELLNAAATTESVKHLELLRLLEHAGRQLVAAADALADGAIKRAH